MQLQFCGAAQEVTGSNHVLRLNGHTLLLDFGMVQGGKEEFHRNREPCDYDCGQVDAVLLSHAHIDHSGRLPLLVQRGFTGPIYTTQASAELTRMLLLDSAHIQEEDAKWKRHRLTLDGRPADWVEPLYSTADAESVIQHLKGVAYDTEFEVLPGVRARFRDAGHMLGSAHVELWLRERGREVKLVFSGDIGRPHTPILRDPTPIAEADFLIVESTYGDKLHKDKNKRERFQEIIRRTVKRGGRVIIPSFAIGRTQELVYELNALIEANELPSIPVFVDSPMAREATELTAKHQELYDLEAKEYLRRGDEPLAFRGLKLVKTVDESKALNEVREPCIIISASGMCTAGRIKHHLKHGLPDAKNTVLFVGYQGVGTLGRQIRDGAQQVKIQGRLIPVRAHIEAIDGYSAHADRDELLAWLCGFQHPPQRTFVVHGEKDVALAFAATIHQMLGWDAVAPRRHDSFELDAAGVTDRPVAADSTAPATTPAPASPTDRDFWQRAARLFHRPPD